jgi:hypothetical protein
MLAISSDLDDSVGARVDQPDPWESASGGLTRTAPGRKADSYHASAELGVTTVSNTEVRPYPPPSSPTDVRFRRPDGCAESFRAAD